MKNEKTIKETSTNEVSEVINIDELITDFSFQYKIFQMSTMLDLDIKNYRLCFE